MPTSRLSSWILLFAIRIVNIINGNRKKSLIFFSINSCGNTAEYCGGGQGGQGGQGGTGTCQYTGCPAGSCCSRFGFCGTSAEHCGYPVGGGGQTGQVVGGGNGNCQATGCGAGLCCSNAGL